MARREALPPGQKPLWGGAWAGGQRGVLFLPLVSFSCRKQAKGGEEGFYKIMSLLLWTD